MTLIRNGFKEENGQLLWVIKEMQTNDLKVGLLYFDGMIQ